MRDYTIFMKRLCVAMGIYVGGAGCSDKASTAAPQAEVAAADTSQDTGSPDGADGADGATDGADASDGTDGTDASDASDGSDGSDGTDGTDGADGSDGGDGADTITPDDALAPDVVDPPPDTGAPDEGPVEPDVAVEDAQADVAPPTCEFGGDPVQTCYTAAALKQNIENPPFGGDAPQPPYEGPLPPEGGPDPELVLDGCCNAAVGHAELKGEECCYYHCQGACCGRPLVVDGAARVAGLEVGSAWTGVGDQHLAHSPIDPDSARRLADAWRADGLDEHASVASFMRFGLELMHLGAPPALVSAAAQAAQDEVRHAEIACRIASALDGGTGGPGRLDCGDVRPRTSWPAIAAACVREGCVGETIAAAQLGLAAAQCTAAFGPLLKGVADDEARHAELAWAFVAWSWREGGEDVRAAIAAAFEGIADAPIAPDPREAMLAGVAADTRRLGGRLPAGDAARVARDTLRNVVAPCARALFSSERSPGVLPC